MRGKAALSPEMGCLHRMCTNVSHTRNLLILHVFCFVLKFPNQGVVGSSPAGRAILGASIRQ